MGNLGILMKTSIINEMGINKLKTCDKKEKAKIIAMILLIGGSIAILGIYGFNLCFYLADFLIKIDQAELLLIIGVIGSAFATLFTCLYKAPSYLFSSKDIEILASLPIKQSTILSSKILTLILNNYLFSSVFILIPAIVYFIKVDTSITYLPYLTILTLSTPLIPITISSILAFFITSISSKMKKNNIVLILLNVLLLVGIMAISFNLQNVVLEIVQNSSSIIEATKKIYPPAYYFVDALKNNNATSLIIFLTVSVASIGIFVYIFSKNFNKINSQMGEKYKVNNYKFIELKSSRPVTALLKKEAKRYFSSTIYFMNTFIGMILLPIFTIAIVVVGYDKITEILGISSMVEMIKMQIIAVVVFCIIMTNTTSVSISLEGKNLWILKSSPINEIDIFKSKIYLNLLLTIPIAVISFLILAIRLSFTIKSTLVVIASIILLAVFNASLGIFINLLYPKLDFTNDVLVVKRSASVIVSMISSLVYVGLVFFILYTIGFKNIDLLLMIANIITFITILFLWRVIKTKGVELFRGLYINS